MILRKAIVLGAAMAMSSAPAALAAPGHGHDYGHGHGHGYGREHGRHARRCVPHNVAYVASGTLVSDTLVEGSDHTYSGEVTVAVQHGNRWARSAFGTNVTYKVEGVRALLGVPDANGDGTVNVADLAAGDRVTLLGRISAQPRSCGSTEAAQPTVWKIIFHPARHHGQGQPKPPKPPKAPKPPKPAPVPGHGHGAPKPHGPEAPTPPAPRCVAQEVGYEASGTLVSDKLTEGSNHTYSGEVTVAVARGNREASSALGKNVTFKVEGIQAILGVPDANGDGIVNSADLVAGDQVDVLGSISALPPSCTAVEAAQPVISKITFHAPRQKGEAPSTAT